MNEAWWKVESETSGCTEGVSHAELLMNNSQIVHKN
jgi:hypothetical protein